MNFFPVHIFKFVYCTNMRLRWLVQLMLTSIICNQFPFLSSISLIIHTWQRSIFISKLKSKKKEYHQTIHISSFTKSRSKSTLIAFHINALTVYSRLVGTLLDGNGNSTPIFLFLIFYVLFWNTSCVVAFRK